MKKLLVTGASGFLGWNLCQRASSRWQVFGTYCRQKVEIPQVSLFKIDLTDDRAIAELFQTIKPDAVIHTAAASRPNYCQTHRDESFAINVTASVHIARLCAEYEIPCAFTSTDLVFDGKNPFYQESDPVSPICYYGEQKVAAERQMSQIYPAIALCRMPLMFGSGSPVSPGFLQGAIATLSGGKKLNLFTDEFRTPASAISASDGLLMAVEKKIAGILHLGGRERVSRYDFGLLVAKIWQLPKDLIIGGRQADVKTVAARSPDTSLDSSKAFSLGYEPQTIEAELMAIFDSKKTER